jgi:murein L,D-transpeptidase YafK
LEGMRTGRWKLFAVVMFLSTQFSFMICPKPGTASTAEVDKVVVIKKERLMELYKNGEIVKTYRVALGRRPEGPKVCAGDDRTPEGTYYLNWRNAHSRFHRSLHISYPNAEDRLRAKALGLSPGSDIMIHGLPKGYGDVGEWQSIVDWTKGCIAVSNPEIDEIWKLVPDGTPIIIKP